MLCWVLVDLTAYSVSPVETQRFPIQLRLGFVLVLFFFLCRSQDEVFRWRSREAYWDTNGPSDSFRFHGHEVNEQLSRREEVSVLVVQRHVTISCTGKEDQNVLVSPKKKGGGVIICALWSCDYDEKGAAVMNSKRVGQERGFVHFLATALIDYFTNLSHASCWAVIYKNL